MPAYLTTILFHHTRVSPIRSTSSLPITIATIRPDQNKMVSTCGPFPARPGPGNSWLSYPRVCTGANLAGDPISIYHSRKEWTEVKQGFL